jgi:hypothetical protein
VYRQPHPGLLSHIKLGLCISGFTFQGGRAAVTVTLPKTESGDIFPDTAGQLLFGWRSPNEEYFAIGLGGHGGAFTLTRYEPNQGWISLAVVGTAKNLTPEQPYNISLHMQGQRISLELDGIRVLTHDMITQPQSGQLGIYAWGEGKVKFTAARLAEEPGKVFVVMPLSDFYLKSVLQRDHSCIEEKDNNLIVHHADETYGPGIIIKDIENDIIESKIVVAEITERNPNVYYEVGYAHAQGKPTILLVQTNTKLPFDMSPYRCILYENSLGGRKTIEERLRNHIRAILGKERDQ